jgi:hypothetical protein
MKTTQAQSRNVCSQAVKAARSCKCDHWPVSFNELAKALERNKLIIPIMLVWVEEGPPTSICRIQWLDMRNYVPVEAQAARFLRILRSVECETLVIGPGGMQVER